MFIIEIRGGQQI